MMQISALALAATCLAACATGGNASPDQPDAALTLDAGSVLAPDAGGVTVVDSGRPVDSGAVAVTPDAAVVGGAIARLRQNNPAAAVPVTLSAVVITGRVSSTTHGHVWVQDAGGGPYSGIHLFCDLRSAGACPMNRAAIDALSVGQVVNVSGKWSVFVPTAPASAQPEMEIDAALVTPTGTTMAPVATLLPSPGMIAKSMANDAGSKPYWGAYVKVNGPFRVASVAPPYEAAACSGGAGTASHGFEATGGGQTLVVDLGFYNTLMTRCLPQCPGYSCASPITTSNSFSSITGVVEPDSNATTGTVFLRISPVTDADLPN